MTQAAGPSRRKRVRPGPRLEALEDRCCPSVTFQFDYSLDTSGFFNVPGRRAALELAGQLLGSQLHDSLLAITPGGANTWTATFPHPSTGANASVVNRAIAANTLLVFAGGRNYAGATLGEGGFGGWSASGPNAWLGTVGGRGQSGVTGAAPTDFGPWGGTLSFDTSTNWWFGGTSAGPGAGQTDFLSVAMHELGHVLGIGTAPSWSSKLAGGRFHGSAAVEAYATGQAPPVDSSGSHWAAGTSAQGAEASLTPALTAGMRKLFTGLDYAALADIGWQVGGGAGDSHAGEEYTVGMFDPNTATWYLRNRNTPGAPAAVFQYGGRGWVPVVGDFNGDGSATVGAFDPNTATWYLRNVNAPGAPDIAFQYGGRGWVPVVGDWNGDNKTDIGAFDPSTATWYLRLGLSAGAATAVFQYGGRGWVPVVGDWNGDNKTDIGAFDPSTATWYLRNASAPGVPDAVFQYGVPGWVPVVGDWDGNGSVTAGVVNPSTATWYLRNANSAGAVSVTPFRYGAAAWRPVAGNWIGHPAGGAGGGAPLKPAEALPLWERLGAAGGAGGEDTSAGARGSGHGRGGYCCCAFCLSAVEQSRRHDDSLEAVRVLARRQDDHEDAALTPPAVQAFFELGR